MTRERVYRTEAVILKRSDIGEADRLLTIYSPAHGKLRVTAKGARKPQSRKSGHVELFTHAQLLIAKGRNLDIVTQAQIIEPFLALRENLERTAYAFYLAELVDQFTEEQLENPPVFDLLLDALRWVGESGDLWLTARFVELHLLSLFGYQPQLHYCVAGDEVIEATDNYFDASRGGVLCPHHGENEQSAQPLALNTLKVLRYLQTAEYAEAMRLKLSVATRIDVEAVMQRYLTYVLERRLKSTEFVKMLAR